MNVLRPRPRGFPWPIAIVGIALAAAWLLSRFQPAPIGFLPLSWSMGIGFILFGCGAVLTVSAARTLHDRATPILPMHGARYLITCGPYRYSRNPMYLGNTLAVLGIGFILGNVWFLVAGLAAATFTDLVPVRREEQHLLALFGADYEMYCRNTRRWI